MKKIKEISGYLGVDQRELELNLGVYNAPKSFHEAQNMYDILINLNNKNLLDKLYQDWNKLYVFALNRSNNLKDLKNLFEKIPIVLPATERVLHKWKIRSKIDIRLPHNLRSLKYLYENIYFRPNDWEMKSEAFAMYTEETEVLLENAQSLKDLKYILMYGEPNIKKRAFEKVKKLL